MTTLFRGTAQSVAYPVKFAEASTEYGTSLLSKQNWPVNGGSGFTNVGTTGHVLSPFGRAWSFNGSSQAIRARMARPLQLATDASVSLVCVFRTTTSVTGGQIASLGSESGGGGTTLCLFRTGTSAARLNVVIQDSSGSSFASLDSSSITTNDGAWHCAVFSCDLGGAGGPANWYIDGVADGSNTGGAGTPTATTFESVMCGGFRRGGTDSFNAASEVALFVPLFRRLSVREGLSLSADPWQLFRRKKMSALIGFTAVGGANVFNPFSGRGGAAAQPLVT